MSVINKMLRDLDKRSAFAHSRLPELDSRFLHKGTASVSGDGSRSYRSSRRSGRARGWYWLYAVLALAAVVSAALWWGYPRSADVLLAVQDALRSSASNPVSNPAPALAPVTPTQAQATPQPITQPVAPAPTPVPPIEDNTPTAMAQAAGAPPANALPATPVPAAVSSAALPAPATPTAVTPPGAAPAQRSPSPAAASITPATPTTRVAPPVGHAAKPNAVATNNNAAPKTAPANANANANANPATPANATPMTLASAGGLVEPGAAPASNAPKAPHAKSSVAAPTVTPQPPAPLDAQQLLQRQQQAGRDALAQAQALWNAGSQDAAVDVLQQAIVTAERSANANRAPVTLQLLVGLVREFARMQLALGHAAALWDTLVRLEPLLTNEPDVWALRANTAQRLGKHAESISAYNRALQLRPGEARWLLGAAVSLAATGNTSAASDMAEKARALGPISREVQTYLRQMGVPLRD